MTTPSTPFVPGAAPTGLSRPGDPGFGPVISVVNQWNFGSFNTYGHEFVNVSNASGNALVAIVALGSNSQNVLPRFNIADDSHNYWQFCGTSMKANPGVNRRVDVWVAPNARAASLVSISESWFTSGACGMILEVANFPTFAQVDFINTSSNFAATATVSGTAPGNDVILAGIVTATPPVNAFLGGVFTSGGYTGLGFTTTGGGSSADMTGLTLAAQINPISLGSQSVTWNWTSGNSIFSAIMIGFSLNPTQPFQPNPNWPSVQVQAAFGWSPGNLAGTMPTWTDISSHATDQRGQVIMRAKRGRNFELDQPSAGTLELTLQNADGAFNPLNSASPYFPNVLPEVPVRVLATWNGRTYPIAWSYASKWPQEWPDPQRGVTNYKGTDTISAASNLKLPSALAGEILIDGPYSYHVLGEFFSTAGGQQFSNLSRTNLKPAYGVDDTARNNGHPLSTGQAMNTPGDTSTGVGISTFPVGLTAQGGPGVYYKDNGMPSLAAGYAIEFWAAIPDSHVSNQSNNYVLDILRLCGLPSNYPLPPTPLLGGHQTQGGDGTRLLVSLSNQNTNGGVTAYLDDYSAAVSSIVTGSTPPLLDTGMHQYVVTIVNNSGTWHLTVYKDGVSVSTGSGSSVASTIAPTIIAMGPLTLGSGYRLATNFTIGQVATFPFLLDPNRIAQHFQTGSTGQSPSNVRSRVAQLFAWSGSQLPFAATFSSKNPLIGNADQIQGQALTDALFALTTEEGGMSYCSGDGSIWYVSRAYFYNMKSRYVFGDNAAAGECPYIDASFDYSDTFLYNVTSSKRTISASQAVFNDGSGPRSLGTFNSFGVTATEADQASEAQFFVRGPLELDGETTSDQDAFDRANWALLKYRQPHLRANQILLNPVSNTSVWRVALGVEQGDIVTVNRRQIGAVPISLQCVVQQVEHQAGPDIWNTILTLAPYYPEGNVIQLDTPGFNTPNSGILAW